MSSDQHLERFSKFKLEIKKLEVTDQDRLNIMLKTYLKVKDKGPSTSGKYQIH